jgi:hypothetical protein
MSAAEEDNPILDALPPAVRAAVEAQDIQALDLALRRMPREEAEALAHWLAVAGILVQRQPGELDAEQRRAYWPPAVANALASGNTDAVYAALAELPPEQADKLYAQLQQQGLL